MTVSVQHSGELQSTGILFTIPDSDLTMIAESPFDLMFSSLGIDAVLDVTSKIIHTASELKKLKVTYDKDKHNM